jgi:hypothetical protein
MSLMELWKRLVSLCVGSSDIDMASTNESVTEDVGTRPRTASRDYLSVYKG